MDVQMEEQAALAQAEYAEVFGGGPKEKAKDKDKEQADQWPDQERKPKYSRGEGKAGKGGSWNAASSWDPKGSWGQQKKWGDQSQNDNSLDAPTQHLIQAMVRLSLRHEQELGMIRAETGFMLFLDTPMHHPMSFLPKLQEIAADWTEKNAAGLVKTGLKVMLMMALVKELQTRLEAFRDDPEKITRPQDGSARDPPRWIRSGIISSGNPKTKQQERSEQHPVSTSVLLTSLDILFKNLAAPGVLQRFRSTKGLEGNFDSVEVVPFLLWIGLRSNQAHLCYQAFMQLAGSAVTKLLGLRNPSGAACQTASSQEGGGMLQGSELLRLEQSQLNELPSRRSCLGRQQGAAGSEGTQQPLPYATSPAHSQINQPGQLLLPALLPAGSVLDGRNHGLSAWLLWPASGWLCAIAQSS